MKAGIIEITILNLVYFVVWYRYFWYQTELERFLLFFITGVELEKKFSNSLEKKKSNNLNRNITLGSTHQSINQSSE